MTATPSQLDRIEAKLDRLEKQLGDLPGMVATAGDTFDDLVDRLPGGAAEADQRMRRAASLLLKVSEPGTLELLEQGVELLKSLPDMVATGMDTFDEMVDRGRDRGIDPNVIVAALFERDVLRADNVEILARAVGEIGNAAEVPEGPIGLFSLLRSMREPEVQRTLGFLIAYARRVGVVLDAVERPATTQLAKRDL